MNDTASLIEHGTHLEALAWAAGLCRPGAVLEVGPGFWSTPWLHGWCEAQARWLLTIECDPAWKPWADKYAGAEHEIRLMPRGVVGLPESFALALVDGQAEDRASWLDELRFSAALVVVHDTEPGRVDVPGVAEALARFAYRRDFTRIVPHTAVVSAVSYPGLART